MTKKEIYAMFDIEYKAGKIKTPYGEYIPELIPIGTNSKVGDAGTWSIFHGNETVNADDLKTKCKATLTAAGLESIKGSCPCHCDGCYCDSGRYNFDSVKAANILKLVLARFYPDFMVNAIKAQIIADDIEQMRIHAAGDFFSPEYVDCWKSIITDFPAVTFWTYTKYEYALKEFIALWPENRPENKPAADLLTTQHKALQGRKEGKYGTL